MISQNSLRWKFWDFVILSGLPSSHLSLGVLAYLSSPSAFSLQPLSFLSLFPLMELKVIPSLKSSSLWVQSSQMYGSPASNCTVFPVIYTSFLLTLRLIQDIMASFNRLLIFLFIVSFTRRPTIYIAAGPLLLMLYHFLLWNSIIYLIKLITICIYFVTTSQTICPDICPLFPLCFLFSWQIPHQVSLVQAFTYAIYPSWSFSIISTSQIMPII